MFDVTLSLVNIMKMLESYVKRTERIQRRASKFILNLPYMSSESYHDRLITLELMPLSYWHEYMDLVFFFKAHKWSGCQI